MSEFLIEAMALAFRAHGIDAQRVEDHLLVGRDLRVAVAVMPFDSPSGSVLIQVDVRSTSSLLPNNIIIDSFAGMGSSREEAEKDALSKFLQGSFHVIAEALTDHHCDSEQVDWLHWSGNGGSWSVCSGPLLQYSTNGATLGEKYFEVLQELQVAFQASSAAKAHWARVFVSALDGEINGLEALIDGAEWGDGLEILRSHPWDAGSGYQNIRHLFIALPESTRHVPAERRGFTDTSRWLHRISSAWRRLK